MNLFELFVKIGVDDQASKGIKNIGKTIQDAKKPVEEYRRDVMKLAQTYKSQGMDMSSAMKKAYSEIDKSQYETAENSKNDSKKFSDNWVDAGEKVSGIANKIGNGLKTVAKIGTAVVGAAATGITALTTAAVNNYAEYEQLVGGVDTLFKNASQKVQQYAADAYKTAGMSANDYMANATAFSASLISALGDDTEAAAEYANRAMVSMSDNANKMGTNIDSIVQTYQSLARGNFAMLDNLKLGYGGTKAELERLIADAASYTEIQKEMGITVDASSTSFDNIVNAIAVVQGKLGIAGATALEAGTTIEGSVNSMKAAWDNLITGVADSNADLDGLMDDFIGSVKNATANIMPTIWTALNGIGKLIQEVVPVAMQYIPQIITEFLPTIGEAAIGIVTSIGTAIFDNIDQILEWGQNMLDTLLEGINSNTGNISSVVTQIVTTFGTFILENLPEIIMAGVNLLLSLVQGIIASIPELATAATQAIIQLASYIISAENLEKLISLGGELINAISEGIESVVADLVSVGEKIVESIKSGIASAWNGLVSWFNNLWNSLFGNRTVNVHVNATTNGSHAGGLAYVPFNGYIAELHKGERVLTASEAKEYNSRNSTNNTSGITIIQNIQSVPQTPVELAAATEAYFEQARWAFA